MTTVAAAPEEAPAGDATVGAALEMLRGLFERLNDTGIPYCHWKSNEHLDASLAGAGDLDLLVDRAAALPLARFLVESGCKRMLAPAGRGYPGIEDWIGFDPATGALSHLHIHYQLTLGEKFLKGHRLPWEDLYLTTRVLDEGRGVYVADPHLELLVLLVRAALKLRGRDRVKAVLGQEFLRGGMLRELRWLAARVDLNRLVELGTRLIGSEAAGMLPAIVTGSLPSAGQLAALRRRITPPLAAYRLYSAGGKTSAMARRELDAVVWKMRNLVIGSANPSRRTLPHGGLSIAFLGADGAGKTTLTGTIAEWLSREVAVVSTYGGSGTGSATLPRRLLQGLARVRRRIARDPAPRVESGASKAPLMVERSGLRMVGRIFWVLSLARERRRRARQARRARGLGMVVLSDRLAQSQFPGWNDGPRLTHWVNDASWIRRTAARAEQAAFRLAELEPPDLVVKLHVSFEVAARRKPDTPPQGLRTGLEMVRAIQFPERTRVVDVDADQPIGEVVMEVKRAVWESL